MRFLRFFCCLVIGLTCFAAAVGVRAETAVPLNTAVLRIADGMMIVDASYNVKFSPAHMKALENGLPLYFVFEWKVTQPRWYWFDKTVTKGSSLLSVTFLPLTRQYRFSSGWLMQDIATAEEAEQMVGHIKSRPLFPLADFDSGERYYLSFRLRLDNERMPKPMQLNTFGSRDWTLSSDWYTLDFIP